MKSVVPECQLADYFATSSFTQRVRRSSASGSSVASLRFSKLILSLGLWFQANSTASWKVVTSRSYWPTSFLKVIWRKEGHYIYSISHALSHREQNWDSIKYCSFKWSVQKFCKSFNKHGFYQNCLLATITHTEFWCGRKDLPLKNVYLLLKEVGVGWMMCMYVPLKISDKNTAFTFKLCPLQCTRIYEKKTSLIWHT